MMILGDLIIQLQQVEVASTTNKWIEQYIVQLGIFSLKKFFHKNILEIEGVKFITKIVFLRDMKPSMTMSLVNISNCTIIFKKL
jgi:hypothetical protein